MDDHQIKHLCHEHLLSYFEKSPGHLDRYVCDLCREICNVDLFLCKSCWENKPKKYDFRLHKRCAELPQEITLPRHNSNHKLIVSVRSLLRADYYAKEDSPCPQLCGECLVPLSFSNFNYSCSHCDFALHPSCAWSSASSSAEDHQGAYENNKQVSSTSFKHTAHHHDMVLYELDKVAPILEQLSNKKDDIVCAWCGDLVSQGMFYACLTCGFYLHKGCTFDMPGDQITHPSHQQHSLHLTVDKTDARVICFVCGDVLDKSICFTCEVCDNLIGLHARCASRLLQIGSNLFNKRKHKQMIQHPGKGVAKVSMELDTPSTGEKSVELAAPSSGQKSVALASAPNTIVPEVLKEDNYERWSILMRLYLISQELWDVVQEDWPGPDTEESSRLQTKQNALALHAIKISCGAEAFDRIKEVDSAKQAWNALEDKYKASSQVQYNYTDGWKFVKFEDLPSFVFAPQDDLIYAIYKGDLSTVKTLVTRINKEDNNIDIAERNINILLCQDENGRIPVEFACHIGNEDITRFLYRETPPEILDLSEKNHGYSLLKECMTRKMLDIAYDLLHNLPELTPDININIWDYVPIFDMINQPQEFPFYSIIRRQLSLWRLCAYHCISIRVDLIKTESNKGLLPVKELTKLIGRYWSGGVLLLLALCLSTMRSWRWKKHEEKENIDHW